MNDREWRTRIAKLRREWLEVQSQGSKREAAILFAVVMTLDELAHGADQ